MRKIYARGFLSPNADLGTVAHPFAALAGEYTALLAGMKVTRSAAVHAVASKLVKLGSRLLNQLGGGTLPREDNGYGRRTRGAVRAVQAALGLPPTALRARSPPLRSSDCSPPDQHPQGISLWS